MFDAISIGRQRTFGVDPLDVGLLAELLVFYGHVRVLVDRGILEALIRGCGAHEFVELVTSGRLQITYLTDGLGIRTDHDEGSEDRHMPTTFLIQGAFEPQNAIPGAFQDATGKSGAGRRFANKVMKHVEEVRFQHSILNGARSDFVDARLMADAARLILPELAPAYSVPKEIAFVVRESGDFLTVDTNLDFSEISRSYHAQHPTDTGAITAAHILSQVLNAHGDLYLAGLYRTELATDPVSEGLIKQKCEALVASWAENTKAIDVFQDLTLSSAGAIREAVNSGQRSFSDVLKLLDSADRFRSWLQDVEPTEDLLREFYKRTTEKSWAEKLPAKTLRWGAAIGAGMLVGGLGVEGLAITTAASAFDAFLLERFARGWRPDQFTDGALRSFVRDNAR